MCTHVHLHHTFDMDRLSDLRATGNLLNRNSKPFSEGRRTKEPSDQNQPRDWPQRINV